MGLIPKETNVTDAYKKDPDEEDFLERLNNVLAPFEEESYLQREETLPTLHVIGVPRSGTTLLLQALCSHLNIGYINNLIAAFWRAPTVGIRLSRKLLPQGVSSSYQSDFARTKGISEPHEFGYFWSSLLGYPELAYQGEDFERTINWNRVKLVITNMSAAYGCPIAFKSFWMAWHMKKMQQVLPKTCLVFIRRNPVDNACSLLRLRRKFLGSADRWASMKPAEYETLKEKPYWDQVAGQVFHIEKSIFKGIRQIEGRNVVELTYEDLCRHPKTEISKVIRVLNDNGGKVGFLSEPPASFSPSVKESISGEERRLVEEAVKNAYGKDFVRDGLGESSEY